MIEELPEEGDTFHDKFSNLSIEVTATEGDFISFVYGDGSEIRIPKSWVYQLVPYYLIPAEDDSDVLVELYDRWYEHNRPDDTKYAVRLPDGDIRYFKTIQGVKARLKEEYA